jgi:hypothetical protein
MRQLKVISPNANCSTCIGSCCAYYTHVMALGEDVQRIAAHFGITFDEAVDKYIVKPDFYAKLGSDGYRLGSGHIKTDNDGICVFFDNGCSLEKIKPSTCANYTMNGKMCRTIYTTKAGEIFSMPSNKNGGVDRLIKLLNRSR